MQFIQREITALASSGHPRAEAQPGQLGGFDLSATTQRILGTIQVTLAFEGVPESDVRLTAKDLADMDASGLIIRLENRLSGLEALRAKTLHEIDRQHAEAAHAGEDSGKPFPQSGQLTAARERVQVIQRQLEEAAKPQQPDQGRESAGADVRDARDQGKTDVKTATAGVGPVCNAARVATPAGHAPNGNNPLQEPDAVPIARHSFPGHGLLADPVRTPMATPYRSAAPRDPSRHPAR